MTRVEFPKVWCSYCGFEVEMVKARVRSKKAGTWKCLPCGVTLTNLYRKYGEFPNFAHLTDAQRQAFYQSARNLGFAKTIESAESFRLEKYQQEEEYFVNGGEFLPLSVWANQGFNTELIVKNTSPNDIRDHDVLGKTYRVKILSTGKRGQQGSRQTHEVASAKGGKTQESGPATVERLKKELKEAKADVSTEKKNCQHVNKLVNSLQNACRELNGMLGTDEDALAPKVVTISQQAVRTGEELTSKLQAAGRCDDEKEVKKALGDLRTMTTLVKGELGRHKRMRLD